MATRGAPLVRFLAILPLLLAGCGKGTGRAPTEPPAAGPVADVDVDDEAIEFDLKGASGAAPAIDPGTAEAADLVSQARATGDLDERIRLLEAAIALSPEALDALLLLVQAAQEKGRVLYFERGNREASRPYFRRSAEAARSLVELGAPLPDRLDQLVAGAFYNAACSCAVMGEPDRAMEFLALALEHGFDQPILEIDPELDPIRDRDDYRALMAPRAAARAAAVAAAEEAVERELAAFEPFPFDFALEDLNGETVGLADYDGRVVIANLWAPTSRSSHDEVPVLIRLQETYGDRGLQVLGLCFENADREALVPQIEAFADQYGMNYPCLIADESVVAQLPDSEGLPATVVVGRDGEVKALRVGFQTADAARLEALVVELLEREAPG